MRFSGTGSASNEEGIRATARMDVTVSVIFLCGRHEVFIASLSKPSSKVL
jgi:hypothetical protein